MKQKHFLPVLCLLCFSACKKEMLDIRSGACFTVEDLLESRNADVPCGKTADFEGLSLCLEGNLESGGPGGNPRLFFLRDAHDEERVMTVVVDSLLSAEVLERVHNNAGHKATVKGAMSGFDQPRNFKCTRGYEQHLSSIADLEIF
jgi:hypothetical protein